MPLRQGHLRPPSTRYPLLPPSARERVLRIQMQTAAGVFLRLFVGVVARTDESSAFDDAQADGEAEFFPTDELFGCDPAFDGKVLGARLKVLAYRENISSVGSDIAERLFDLCLLLAEAEHDACFGREAAAFGVAQHGPAAVVTGLHANGLLEPFHRFHVVIKNIGLRVENHIDVVRFAFEIGNENFDRGVRVAMTNSADRRCPDAGAAIGEFVAGHACDDAMAKVHRRDGFSDSCRFAEIELRGTAGLNRAEITGTRADISENHQGRGTARPTLAQVRALRALADGVELVLVDQISNGSIARP